MKKNSNYITFLLLIAGVLLVAACYFYSAGQAGEKAVLFSDGSAVEGKGQIEARLYTGQDDVSNDDADDVSIQDFAHAKKQDGQLFVYVCGAVRKEGVYALPKGARVKDAVAAAGGFTKKADKEAVNLAKLLADEEQIVVAKKSKHAFAGQEQEEMKININTADSSELMRLNGIGEAKALAIIAYRDEKGSFASIEEITRVPGIKEGTYNQIKDRITV